MTDLFDSLAYETHPFPLLIGSLPAEFYQRVDQGWPDMAIADSDGRGNRPVMDDTVVNAIHALMRQSHRFFRAVVPPITEDPRHIRVQYSQNSDSQDHVVPIRGWHLDNGNKYLVGLWYFGEPGDQAQGDLMLLNPETGEKRMVEYGPNRMVIFPNTIYAWHGITDRQRSAVCRRFLNIVLEDQGTQVKMHQYGPESDIDPEITRETLDDAQVIARFNKLKNYAWLGQDLNYASHVASVV